MRIRRFVSLTLLLSFVVMSFTGIMLFIVPKGRVANWVHWRMFGLTKTQYGDIHTTTMILFLILVVWHIVLNWKPMINYIKGAFVREFLYAFVLVSTFVVGTLAMVPPFSSFVNLGNSIKGHWARRYGAPPYGHAEESTLGKFCSYVGIEPSKALELLRSKGIKVKGLSETLNDIARRNSITPQMIYLILKHSPSGSSSGWGQGGFHGSYDLRVSGVPQFLGRRTLGELDAMGKIKLEVVVKFLKKRGVKADKNSMIRDIAKQLGVTPVELYEELVDASRGKHS